MSAPAKYTPGPWELATVLTQIGVCHKIGRLGSSTKMKYACLYDDCYSDMPRDLQLLADARLIAQAPAMAGLLRKLIENDTGIGHIRDSAEYILAVIDGDDV